MFKDVNKIIETNLRFVVYIAKKFTNRGLDIADLIQEGNFGVYEALKRFDISKGVRFYSYARWWIEKYITMALNNNDEINNNETILINNNDENEDRRREEDGIYYEARNEEENYESSFEDSNEREKGCMEIIENLLSNLDERTKEVIELCYGLNDKEQLTMVEIAKVLNITPERVRQIKNKGMIELRSYAIAQSISYENINCY